MVRDPIRHRRSIYYVNFYHAKSKYRTLLEWIVSSDYPANWQINFFSGRMTLYPGSHHTYPFPRLTPEEEFAIARQNLIRTAWFGITERWEESMCLLFFTFNLPWKQETSELARQRPANLYPPSSLEEEELILEKSQLEYEFFHFANLLMDYRLELVRNSSRPKPKPCHRVFASE
jgi:hypothetical protein